MVRRFPSFRHDHGAVISMKLPEVTEAVVDTPITITPAAGGAAQPLISGQDKRWVFSFLLRERSMGTATYVRVGNIYGQTY